MYDKSVNEQQKMVQEAVPYTDIPATRLFFNVEFFLVRNLLLQKR